MEIQRIKLPVEERKLLFDFMDEDPGPAIDFNWLMSIVEKIEGLGFRTSIVLNSKDDRHGHHILIKEKDDSIIIHVSDTVKKIAVKKAVVEFVRWYKSTPDSLKEKKE